MSKEEYKDAIRGKVRNILQLCDPGKAEKVDMLLNKFEGRERELFRKLQDTYSANENYPKLTVTELEEEEKELNRLLNALDQANAEPEEEEEPAANASPAEKPVYYASEAPVDLGPKAKNLSLEEKEQQSRSQALKQTALKKQEEAERAAREADDHTNKNTIPEIKPVEFTDDGEMIVRTCMWTKCRNARMDNWLCKKHAKLEPRSDGLIACINMREVNKATTMMIEWHFQFLVLPSDTKLGKNLTEPLITTSKHRFSDLEALHKKIVKIHKEKHWLDDLKELPAFAPKHGGTSMKKFFGGNDMFSDSFLDQRAGEINTWLNAMINSTKCRFIPEFWNKFGLDFVDGDHLEVLPF